MQWILLVVVLGFAYFMFKSGQGSPVTVDVVPATRSGESQPIDAIEYFWRPG